MREVNLVELMEKVGYSEKSSKGMRTRNLKKAKLYVGNESETVFVTLEEAKEVLETITVATKQKMVNEFLASDEKILSCVRNEVEKKIKGSRATAKATTHNEKIQSRKEDSKYKEENEKLKGELLDVFEFLKKNHPDVLDEFKMSEELEEDMALLEYPEEDYHVSDNDVDDFLKNMKQD